MAMAACGVEGNVAFVPQSAPMVRGIFATLMFPLPEGLDARVTGRIAQIKAHDAAEVEQILARLRAANVPVEDLEIGRADLEDVFLDIMNGVPQ